MVPSARISHAQVYQIKKRLKGVFILQYCRIDMGQVRVERKKRRVLPVYFHLTFKISSAEQPKKLHSLESVASVGWMRPDKYCETVGQETPIARAISVFVFPDCSISSFKFLLMISSNVISILLLY